MNDPSQVDYLRNRPTLDEFPTLARTEFAFLVLELGFTEEPLPDSK